MATPYRLITEAADLRAACEALSRFDAVGFDCETTALDPYAGRLRLVQLAAAEGPAYLFDLFRLAPAGDTATAESLEPLGRLLAAPRPVKVAHNGKFDGKWVRHHLGVELGGLFDTMLASQLVSAGETEDRHGLAVVAERYLKEEVDKTQQLSDWGGELSDAQLEYAARDAALMLPLRERLIERLKSDGLVKVAQIEFECVVPVAALELAGLYLDAVRWREQIEKVKKERAVLAEELQSLLAEGSAQGSLFANARADINLDSHTQLSAALKRMGVPLPDSTRNWKLQPLAKDYPVISKLLDYRTVQKSLTSYGENILEEINPVTGRIRASFHQIGAPTGRFAVTNPNVQQIPHATEYRRCVRAQGPGRKLVIADYSQIELRILAHVTEDKGFIEAFNSGADLHRVTAAQIFNTTEDGVTREQRDFAKRLNFGVVYGIGAQRFSMMTGLPLSDAEAIMARYFQTYRGLDQWLREAARKALRERQARTPAGRLARFNFDAEDRQAASLAQRNGKNMPIQGGSADILKRALRLLHDRLRGTSGEIVNIVHDEIVVECDAAEAGAVAQTVEESMCAAGQEFVTRVPIKVETEVADEWVK